MHSRIPGLFLLSQNAFSHIPKTDHAIRRGKITVDDFKRSTEQLGGSAETVQYSGRRLWKVSKRRRFHNQAIFLVSAGRYQAKKLSRHSHRIVIQTATLSESSPKRVRKFEIWRWRRKNVFQTDHGDARSERVNCTVRVLLAVALLFDEVLYELGIALNSDATVYIFRILRKLWDVGMDWICDRLRGHVIAAWFGCRLYLVSIEISCAEFGFRFACWCYVPMEEPIRWRIVPFIVISAVCKFGAIRSHEFWICIIMWDSQIFCILVWLTSKAF